MMHGQPNIKERTRKYGKDLSGSVEYPGMSYLAQSKEPLVYEN